MTVLQEFKEFAIKGNAMDLAIGVIIGAAFQKIVNSHAELRHVPQRSHQLCACRHSAVLHGKGDQ